LGKSLVSFMRCLFCFEKSPLFTEQILAIIVCFMWRYGVYGFIKYTNYINKIMSLKRRKEQY